MRRLPLRCYGASASRYYTMKAAVAWTPNSRFAIENVEMEAPRSNEMLIRIVASGICHTDAAVVAENIPTNFPIVLGHEGAGIVESVGSMVRGFCVGDRVVMSYSYCGECLNCNRDKPWYCINHRACNFDGSRFPDKSTYHSVKDTPIHGSFFGQSSFSEYALVNPRNVVKVDSALPLKTLAPLGCGIQTGAGAVFNTLRPNHGDAIAVFGCGPVGLAAIMAARLQGCSRIVATDILQSRLDIALSMGATDVVRSGDSSTVVTKLLSNLDGVIDTTGRPEVLQFGFENLVPGGQAVLVGGSAPGSVVQADMLKLLLGRGVKGVIQVYATWNCRVLTFCREKAIQRRSFQCSSNYMRKASFLFTR